jgi:FkbM family methyltransferase
MSQKSAVRKKPEKRLRTPAVSTVIPLPANDGTEALQNGLKFQQAGKLEDAVRAYDDVLKVQPNRIAALVNKGVALRNLKRYDEAMACFWRAIATEPDNLQAWHNAANTLLDQGRLGEAREALRVAIEKAPALPEVWTALSKLLVNEKQFPAAEAALQRSLALRPGDHSVRLQWAGLLLEQRRLPEALAECQALQRAIPQESLAHSETGQTLIGLGRIDEALVHLHHAVKCNPDNLDAHLGLARGYLLKGDFSPGWREYESRRHRTDKKMPRIYGAEWDGSDPQGKTILVYAEQGFGDTIQFLRYLPLLAKRGARVVVLCQKSLASLVERIEGVALAHILWRPLPAYDFFVPLLSLPHKMGLGDKPIPAQVPYLVSHKQAQLPRPPLGTKLRVGLVWAGSPTNADDRNRTVGLEALLPLAGIPGVRLYSLQHGPHAADAAKMAHPALIKDFSKHLKDFADTAAVISQLDLVITVCSAVAHLAGALGKPVWVMIHGIPDWRWQTERSDSPWYPSLRLFRQVIDGDWSHPVAAMTDQLREMAARAPLLEPEPATVAAHSVFAKPDGTPRFTMSAPREFLNDPGVGFLIRRERAGTGYEYATRALLDAHLEPGDLYLDVGAHWGIMALHAATSPAGAKKTRKKSGKKDEQVHVLAFEPAPHNVVHLKRWIDENGVTEQVEVIAAAASDRPGQGGLRPESTMGHSLVRTDEGDIPVVTIDDELRKRPKLAGRRTVVKIDVEGHEPEVIAGMKNLLASGNVPIVIWERGIEYSKPEGQERLKALRAGFDALGYTAWRFESEDQAGKLVPFIDNGRIGNVIEFASGVKRMSCYGDPRPPPVKQPPDPLFDIAERARALMQEGTQLYKGNKVAKALELYGEAGSLDGTARDIYNNIGVMLTGTGRQAAKIAAYRRAHAIAPDDPGIMSNLGNGLRENGQMEEAKSLYDRALAIAPGNPDFMYNAGLVSRDDGRPDEAFALFDKALALKPDDRNCRWDRALVLLQSGDYARGLPAYEARWGIDRAYKRNVPLTRWDGSPLAGRSIFLHDEQGFGDVMQFARFIPELKKKYGAGKVVLECQPELMRLMTYAPGIDAVIPRERALPQCDVYCPLLSLPGIFGTTLKTLPATVPYLYAPEMNPDTAKAFPKGDRLKVGLVWAGQLVPRDRSCALQKILPLLGDPRIAPISLQVGGRTEDLKTYGADTFITNMGPYLRDFAETAAAMEQLDLMITIDTSVAHLAGALGIPTFLLLRYTSDWRWFDRIKTSPWYPSFTLFRQTNACRWDEPLVALGEALKIFADQKQRG